MATSGININKIDQTKIALLGHIQSIQIIMNRIDDCKDVLQRQLDGPGKSDILSKLDAIRNQLPRVNSNINEYINTLSKVVTSYENQDKDNASNLTKNISKLES